MFNTERKENCKEQLERDKAL